MGSVLSAVVDTVELIGGAVGAYVDGLFGGGGGYSSYHPGPSKTEIHAKKIADELADMKKNIRKTSEERERKIIDLINQSMTDFIKELEGINQQDFSGKRLNIDINGIKEKNEALEKGVVGYIGNFMDGRLVLTDRELSVILEEMNDKKRARNFDNFCKRLQKEALSGLAEKIKITVHKQEEMIRREIQGRLNEVDKNMKEVEKSYTDILHIKEKDEAKMDTERIKYVYKYGLAEILLEQLEV